MRSTTPGEVPGWLRGFEAACALILLASSSSAAAGSFSADLTGHYSNVDNHVMVLQPDSTYRNVRQSVSLWSQEYRAGYSTMLPMRTSLVSELRYLDVSLVGTTDHSTTPYGLLRLTAPIAGLNLSYQPSRRTIENLVADDTTGFQSQRLVSRFADFQFGAYVAPSRLPRVDAQFNQQHHVADALSSEGTSTHRSLRAAQDFRHLAVHGGYSDQENRQDGTRQVTQRSWNAGFDLRAPAGRRHSATLGYEFLRGERPAQGGWSGSDNHSVNAYGTYRFSGRSWLNGGGYYNLAKIRSPQRLDVKGYDAYVYHNYVAGRGVTTRVGGGEHTYQDRGRTSIAPYLLALISAAGTPRPRWRARTNFTHSTNWIEGGGPSSTESFGVGSEFDVSQMFGAHVEANAGVRTGAVILGPQRFNSVTSGGVRVQPLRGLGLTVDGSSQAVGGSVFAPHFRASSGSITLLWQPSQGTTFSASRSVAGAYPHNQPRTHSNAISGTWRMSRMFQLDGNYSNSSITGATRPVQQAGRETFGFRLNGVLTRRLSTAIGYQETGRGEPGDTRALDVTATYRFEL